MTIEGSSEFALICLIIGLGIAAVFDIRTLRIPRIIPRSLLTAWLLFQGLGLWIATPEARPDLLQWDVEAVVGALGLVGALWLIAYAIGRGREEPSFGVGDLKLIANVALYLGWERTLLVLLLACGCAIGFSLLLPRVGWNAPEALSSTTTVRAMAPVVPFAPPIALATLIVLLL